MPLGRTIERTIQHVLAAVHAAPRCSDPFHHLQLADVFPEDVYSEMLAAMPERKDYRLMSGRTRSTRTSEGTGTRTKIDLFPEYIRHLPREKKGVWSEVGQALRSPDVREAFRHCLSPGLEERFGPGYKQVGMYPIPILTRDVPGYFIDVHPDTHWKGMTIQFYLPPDNAIEHVGTAFHKRTDEDRFEKVSQMPFRPNTGYAFAVGERTYHSVETLGPEIRTRDSILLTYFVDKTPLQRLRNRYRRFGNFVLNEFRSIGR